MRTQLAELWRCREVISLLIRRELRLRYKNSILGFVWSLVSPIVQCLMIWFVFREVFKLPISNYSAYLFCAYVPWTFFQLTMLDSCSCILLSGALVKKIYFPREMLPIVTVGANFVHFLLALCVYFVYMMLIGIHIQRHILWLPVIILMMLMTATGLALMLSCLNVYFEDVKYLVQTFMAILLFATPVIYQADSLSDRRYVLSQLNPFGVVVTQFQKALLPVPQFVPRFVEHPRPLDLKFIAIGAVVSICIAMLGFYVFERYKWDLAERL